MRTTSIKLSIIALALIMMSVGCASTKNHCGCPNKSGLVGYK
jgi:hypothetical protein